MEEVVAVAEENGGEIYYLHDVLSNNAAEDPSMVAARKLDWQEFVADLPARERAVVEFLIEGASGSAITRKLKVDSSKIRAIKQHLAQEIVEFMGPHILIEIQCRPQWKQNLETTREKMALKHEKSH
jgi:hypothetical protein